MGFFVALFKFSFKKFLEGIFPGMAVVVESEWQSGGCFGEPLDRGRSDWIRILDILFYEIFCCENR